VEELAEMEKAAASTPPAPPDSDADDIMRTQSGKIIHMHSDVWGHWSQTDHTAIRVRGAEYLYDQVKIPPPCPPMMEIAHLEIYQVQGQIFHVCSKKDNWLQQYKAKQKQKLQGGGGSVAAPSAPSAKGKHHHHKARGSAGSSPALAPAAAPASAPAPAPAAASSGGWGAGYFGWGSSASVPPPMPALPDLSSGAGLRPFDPDFFFVRITDSDARQIAIARTAAIAIAAALHARVSKLKGCSLPLFALATISALTSPPLLFVPGCEFPRADRSDLPSDVRSPDAIADRAPPHRNAHDS